MMLILVALNAIAGFAVFNAAWTSTKRYRVQDPVRDQHYPAWRRDDAKNWNYFHMLPFALTILVPRIIWWVATATFMLTAHLFLFIG